MIDWQQLVVRAGDRQAIYDETFPARLDWVMATHLAVAAFDHAAADDVLVEYAASWTQLPLDPTRDGARNVARLIPPDYWRTHTTPVVLVFAGIEFAPGHIVVVDVNPFS